MKTHLTMVFILVASIMFTGFHTDYYIDNNENTIEATFDGITEDGKYKFIDSDEQIVLFDAISSDVDIDLNDEENLEVLFSITWEEEVIELEDEFEEPTGETQIFKTITKLISL